jgi:hypothetical protein
LLNNEHAEDCEYVRLTGGHNKWSRIKWLKY